MPLRRNVNAWMPSLSRRLLLGASPEFPSGSKTVGGNESAVMFGFSSKVKPMPCPVLPVPTIPLNTSLSRDLSR